MFLRSSPLCYGGFALAYSQSDCLTEHPHCAHGSEMAQKKAAGSDTFSSPANTWNSLFSL